MIVINQILAGIRPEFENTPLEFRAVIGKAWGGDAKSWPSAAQMACVYLIEERIFIFCTNTYRYINTPKEARYIYILLCVGTTPTTNATTTFARRKY